MTAVSRFFYVRTPLGRVKHICYSHRHVEGERTACGILLGRKWTWAKWWSKLARIPRCSKCEKADVT